MLIWRKNNELLIFVNFSQNEVKQIKIDGKKKNIIKLPSLVR